VTPSARERFTPREITAAYGQFIERGAQYLDAPGHQEEQAFLLGHLQV
jgi:hypothetical protein